MTNPFKDCFHISTTSTQFFKKYTLHLHSNQRQRRGYGVRVQQKDQLPGGFHGDITMSDPALQSREWEGPTQIPSQCRLHYPQATNGRGLVDQRRQDAPTLDSDGAVLRAGAVDPEGEEVGGVEGCGVVVLGEGVAQLVHSVLEVVQVVREVLRVRMRAHHHLQQIYYSLNKIHFASITSTCVFASTAHYFLPPSPVSPLQCPQASGRWGRWLSGPC